MIAMIRSGWLPDLASGWPAQRTLRALHQLRHCHDRGRRHRPHPVRINPLRAHQVPLEKGELVAALLLLLLLFHDENATYDDDDDADDDNDNDWFILLY